MALTQTIKGTDGNDNSLLGGKDISGSSANEDIFALQGDDRVFGNGGNDFIFGNEGNDTLDGGTGNDILDGGSGTNTLVGGLGNDTYRVSSASDTITENSGTGSGIDVVETSLVSFTLGANLENLTFTASGAHQGTGNELNNTLTGNGGSDTLSGKAGNDTLLGDSFPSNSSDTLLGGSGNDKLVGGGGLDKLTGGTNSDSFVFFNLSDGGDTITDFTADEDVIQISKAGFEAAGFAGLQIGTLSASQFQIGFKADSLGDRFIYNQQTGGLFFDRDGNKSGGVGQVQIATLTGAPVISANNIVII